MNRAKQLVDGFTDPQPIGGHAGVRAKIDVVDLDIGCWYRLSRSSVLGEPRHQQDIELRVRTLLPGANLADTHPLLCHQKSISGSLAHDSVGH